MATINIKNKTGRKIKSVTITTSKGKKRTIGSKDFNKKAQQDSFQRKLRREAGNTAFA